MVGILLLQCRALFQGVSRIQRGFLLCCSGMAFRRLLEIFLLALLKIDEKSPVNS
jgi:hypothetical protein